MYKYYALPDPSTHIRTLRFESNALEGNIHCTLETYQLTRSPPFAAVSYMWGSSNPTNHILVNNKRLPVRKKIWMIFS